MGKGVDGNVGKINDAEARNAGVVVHALNDQWAADDAHFANFGGVFQN